MVCSKGQSLAAAGLFVTAMTTHIMPESNVTRIQSRVAFWYHQAMFIKNLHERAITLDMNRHQYLAPAGLLYR